MNVMVVWSRHVARQVGHGSDNVCELLSQGRLSLLGEIWLQPHTHGAVPQFFQNVARFGRPSNGLANQRGVFRAKIAMTIGVDVEAQVEPGALWRQVDWNFCQPLVEFHQLLLWRPLPIVAGEWHKLEPD